MARLRRELHQESRYIQQPESAPRLGTRWKRKCQRHRCPAPAIFQLVIPVTGNFEFAAGYLFVGDSRTVGLDEAVSGVSSIAKVGAGVTYFKSILPEVTKVRGKNVIFNFGVNDRDRYKDYVAVYKSLPKEFIQKNNVIFMSVNPTDGSKYGSWNADIDKFNAYVKKNLPSGIKYLNTNSTLKKEGFQTRDGCHYKPVTYKRIAQLTFIFCGDKNRKP